MRKAQTKLVQRWAADGGGYELARLTAADKLRSCAPLYMRAEGEPAAWVEPVAARQRDIAAITVAAAGALQSLEPRNQPGTEPALLKWLATWLRTTKLATVFSVQSVLIESVLRNEVLTRAAHRAGYTWWK